MTLLTEADALFLAFNEMMFIFAWARGMGVSCG